MVCGAFGRKRLQPSLVEGRPVCSTFAQCKRAGDVLWRVVDFITTIVHQCRALLCKLTQWPATKANWLPHWLIDYASERALNRATSWLTPKVEQLWRQDCTRKCASQQSGIVVFCVVSKVTHGGVQQRMMWPFQVSEVQDGVEEASE